MAAPLDRLAEALPALEDSAKSDADVVREQELIARVRNGDSGAFETIFRQYWDALYNFAFRYLHNADEAEDAVQTVFARIWRGRAQWTVGGSLPKYLYLAVRNASCDRVRRDVVARHWREKQVEALRHDPSLGVTRYEAESLLAASDLDAAMERALAELAPRQREVFLLRVREELSYPEIAQRLGIATKTVENHLAVAYKTLRALLRAEAG